MTTPRPTIERFIQGHPVAQPRKRINYKAMRQYDDKDHGIHSWREMIKLTFMGMEPIAWQALRIDWVCVFPRGKSHWSKRDSTALVPSAPLHHTAKPDRDNLDKPLLDELTKMGKMPDDAVVTQGKVFKRYQRTKDEPIGMYVRVSEARLLDPAWIKQLNEGKVA
jgi:Holliday junction resolvase RusA-like endonuclease